MTGRTISGTEAAAIGLATGVVSADELQATVAQVAEKLSSLSPAALGITVAPGQTDAFQQRLGARSSLGSACAAKRECEPNVLGGRHRGNRCSW